MKNLLFSTPHLKYQVIIKIPDRDSDFNLIASVDFFLLPHSFLNNALSQNYHFKVQELLVEGLIIFS